MHERVYWFRKTGPAHWTPCSWQGWVTTAAFIALTYLGIRAASQDNAPLWLSFCWAGACVTALLVVVMKTAAP